MTAILKQSELDKEKTHIEETTGNKCPKLSDLNEKSFVPLGVSTVEYHGT